MQGRESPSIYAPFTVHTCADRSSTRIHTRVHLPKRGALPKKSQEPCRAPLQPSGENRPEEISSEQKRKLCGLPVKLERGPVCPRKIDPQLNFRFSPCSCCFRRAELIRVGRLSLPLQARRASWANKGKEGRKFQTAVKLRSVFYLSERPFFTVGAPSTNDRQRSTRRGGNMSSTVSGSVAEEPEKRTRGLARKLTCSVVSIGTRFWMVG